VKSYIPGRNTVGYFRTGVKDVLARFVSHHYATAIDAAELSVIQRYFASGAQPATVWNHEDIQQLLRTLLHEKQELLVQYGRYQSVLGVWYDLMAWVNELFPDQNYVVISLEDSIPNFVHRLFTKYFARETVYRRDQSPQDSAWLGKLALLHLGDVWWEQPDVCIFSRRWLRNTISCSASTDTHCGVCRCGEA